MALPGDILHAPRIKTAEDDASPFNFLDGFGPAGCTAFKFLPGFRRACNFWGDSWSASQCNTGAR